MVFGFQCVYTRKSTGKWKIAWTLWVRLKVYGYGYVDFRDVAPIVAHCMEKKLDHEMETAFHTIRGLPLDCT